jgi:hypothetical protein
MIAEISPKISLIIGCVLGCVGILYSLGIVFPKLRGRWGRRGKGAPFSLLSQILSSLIFIVFGGTGILIAYHQAWINHAFLYILFPVYVCSWIMVRRDNRAFKRDGKNVA